MLVVGGSEARSRPRDTTWLRERTVHGAHELCRVIVRTSGQSREAQVGATASMSVAREEPSPTSRTGQLSCGRRHRPARAAPARSAP